VPAGWLLGAVCGQPVADQDTDRRQIDLHDNLPSSFVSAAWSLESHLPLRDTCAGAQSGRLILRPVLGGTAAQGPGGRLAGRQFNM
jgi:hypothetical protein